jgi:acetyl-CoA C-acetyltransferase
MNEFNSKPIYIVDFARTPFLKARKQRGPFAAADLAVAAGRDILSRQSFSADQVDALVLGCMMPSEDEANIARLVSLRLGCGQAVPAYTVQRNCASGMQAIDSAMKDIILGRRDLMLAGGTEVMSRAPLIFNAAMTNWFAQFSTAKTTGAKLSALSKFKLKFLQPIIALLHGLTDPICGYNMGQTAELVAYRFGITREEMDVFSARSHQLLAQAYDAGLLTSLVDVYDAKGKFYQQDDGLRRDTSVEKLAKLRPNFDRKFGMVTPGNSSQLTDGAAMLLLASEDAVKQYNLEPIGRIVDVEWAGCDPKVMGLGPVYATSALLRRHQYGFDDIDYFEINEAFAAQVLGCVKAWEDDKFCQQELGLTSALGSLPLEKLNIHGGAIAQGHPVGASGARLPIQLINILKQKQAKRGIATLCIGGGQGGAMLIETV